MALRALVDRVTSLEASADGWQQISDLLEKIVASGVRVGPLPRAQLAYRAGHLEQAVKLWDEAGERRSAEY